MLELFPRVTLADRPTEFVITDSKKRFEEGLKIHIAVQSMEKYNVPHSEIYRIDEQQRFIGFDVYVKGGEAKFEQMLLSEQRHLFFITINGKTLIKEVYSLYEDLYNLNPYKGDTHMHTTASDGLHSPLDTAFAYYDGGFDYISITDHHVYKESAALSKRFSRLFKDFYVYPGEEVHNRGMGYFHIINFGSEKSVNEIINENPDKLANEMVVIGEKSAIDFNLPDYLDKTEFAYRYWIANKIKEFGGLAILCHPYWDAYGEYNMQTQMLEYLLSNKIFSAFEICDDCDRTGNGLNLQVETYYNIQSEGIKIPVVGASDCHDYTGYLFGKFYTYAFCDKVSEVKDAIVNFRTVAVERIDSEYRVHGPLRLVKYTRFLIDNFEKENRKIKLEYSDALKTAVDNDDAEAVKELECKMRIYRNKFFGK